MEKARVLIRDGRKIAEEMVLHRPDRWKALLDGMGVSAGGGGPESLLASIRLFGHGPGARNAPFSEVDLARALQGGSGPLLSAPKAWKRRRLRRVLILLQEEGSRRSEGPEIPKGGIPGLDLSVLSLHRGLPGEWGAWIGKGRRRSAEKALKRVLAARLRTWAGSREGVVPLGVLVGRPGVRLRDRVRQARPDLVLLGGDPGDVHFLRRTAARAVRCPCPVLIHLRPRKRGQDSGS